jgi:cardiolipin synthase
MTLLAPLSPLFLTSSYAFYAVINFIFVVIVIFAERKNPTSALAWIMVSMLLPGVGFIFYFFFGRNLSRRKIFNLPDNEQQALQAFYQGQAEAIRRGEWTIEEENGKDYADQILLHLNNSNSLYFEQNEVKLFTDGVEKFQSLFSDLRAATDHIHLDYYILNNDQLGNELIEILEQKAKEGVAVRLLFDELGGRTLRKSKFKVLIENGGQYARFFSSPFRLINPRINYRNHRKIAVIDGRIGYIGGFNIGDEYIGKSKKFGYWRDSALRIQGESVYELQTRFMLDWRAASKEDLLPDGNTFPYLSSEKVCGIQIVSSGPDEEWEQVKSGYIKMIQSAKESVYIHTPYFIPDEAVLEALRIAAFSGVDVRLIIPNKPDHPFVYWASTAWASELLKAGGRVYTYEKGFLHSKTMVVDSRISSCGTANFDYRSFKLNFEVVAFLYNREIAQEMEDAFLMDLKDCLEMTKEVYENRSLRIRFKEQVSRLLSPLL